MRDIEVAIGLLGASVVPIERRDYGFRVMHPDLKGRGFMDCGIDNDGSVSISLHTDENPPAVWFFRRDFVEMANFLITAYKETGTKTPSRSDIVAAMRKLDQDYDDTELRQLTHEFLSEIDND